MGSSWHVRLFLATVLLGGCTGAIGRNPDGDGTGGGAGNALWGGGRSGHGGGPGGVVGADCKQPAVDVARWRRLTAVQYRNTISDLTGLSVDTTPFLQDTTVGPFAANALVAPQPGDIDAYQVAAETIASDAVRDLTKLTGCDAAVLGDEACAFKFIDAFATRAFRGPMLPPQREALIAAYRVGRQESHATGIRLVVESVLQSPSFLYIAEFGEPTDTPGLHRLSGYEVATRLSYLLWSTSPDAALAAAAADGTLDAPDGIREQAVRMMASPRFRKGAASFVAQMFEVSRLGVAGAVVKDPNKSPDDSALLRASMQEEVSRFVDDLFVHGDGSLRTLLTATHGFPAGPLLKIYGVAADQIPADGRYEFAAGTRAGLLTQAGFLAAVPAIPTAYTAVHRGKMLRTHVMCQTLPPPMANIDFTPPPGADKLSQQQLAREHQENPTCVSCHELMDPLGFALEKYDALGRFRTTDAGGNPIDSSGELVGLDVDGTFDGIAALAGKLADSRDVSDCFAIQWFRFAFGREPGEADRCGLTAVKEALAAANGDLREGLLALVASDVFRFRKMEAP